MMDKIEDQRRHLMKRLRMTGKNETICLMDWETRIIIEWIEELKRGKKHEPVDDHR